MLQPQPKKAIKQQEKEADKVFYIPDTKDDIAPIPTVVILQILAYYLSVARGCDVDKPRNLAKSVTVEQIKIIIIHLIKNNKV